MNDMRRTPEISPAGGAFPYRQTANPSIPPRVNIGIPKEIKSQENRVSMIPGSVSELVKRGHLVWIERGAGEGASYADELYEAAGATVVETAAEVFDQAELIVKVKEPQPGE